MPIFIRDLISQNLGRNYKILSLVQQKNLKNVLKVWYENGIRDLFIIRI